MLSLPRHSTSATDPTIREEDCIVAVVFHVHAAKAGIARRLRFSWTARTGARHSRPQRRPPGRSDSEFAHTLPPLASRPSPTSNVVPRRPVRSHDVDEGRAGTRPRRRSPKLNRARDVTTKYPRRSASLPQGRFAIQPADPSPSHSVEIALSDRPAGVQERHEKNAANPNLADVDRRSRRCGPRMRTAVV
jgi:hypothetical protein